MFGAVGDFTVFVGSVLRFRGKSVIILLGDCLDVTLHGYTTGALFVLPVEVDSVGIISFPISGDVVALFESGEEVFGVAFLHIINTKIIYHK